MEMIIIITKICTLKNTSYAQSHLSYSNSKLRTEQNSAVLQLSCINSGQLLGQHDVVMINHQGQLYYLRQTKAGKLILTK